ncbi:MAG TPA: hypothetical protein VGH44_05105, partial [Candidatus Saccharimonadia bacterium]
EGALAGTPTLAFQVPAGITLASVCPDGGLADGFSTSTTEAFMSDAMPTKHCSSWGSPSPQVQTADQPQPQKKSDNTDASSSDQPAPPPAPSPQPTVAPFPTPKPPKTPPPGYN